MRTEDLWSTGEGAAKKKGGTIIVSTHFKCIKVFEKAIDNSPWGAFVGDTKEGKQVKTSHLTAVFQIRQYDRKQTLVNKR